MKYGKAFFLILTLVFTLCACRKDKGEGDKLSYYTTPYPYDIVSVEEPPASNEIRNVIFLIGDGMGLEQASCAWVLNHGKLNLDNMSVVGLSRTYCLSDLITDSAAGGTALAVGQKTAYSHVGTDADGNPIPSMLVKAQQCGKKTGVVVTCHLADATPADFCCHSDDRYKYDEVIAGYAECGVDYIAGGGRDYFGKNRKDARNIDQEMGVKGYALAYDEVELMAAHLPILALLADDNLPNALERGDLFRHMAAKGLEELSSQSGDKGFVYMIEGSSIDDWLHANRIDLAMEELLDFDRVLGDVLQWAAADGHTLVVVTADHATGALTLQDGDLAEGRIGVAFGNDSHNGIAVPYYVWGPGRDRFSGIMENAELGARIAACIQ
ncbi:MAG: alkaline phosphatase [Bacteroidales bacterium]|nr:alkaline phosphatase [Bacteroidales bacterium]